MSPAGTCAWVARPSFPRVSGDEPVWDGGGVQNTEFSPRERG